MAILARLKKITPLRDLLNDSRTTGVLLLGCTLISLFISNSYSGGWFSSFWTEKLSAGRFAGLHLPSTPLDWINNFGMSFFFVLAATEIKRELLSGELSSFKKALLPFGAAFGGMLVPALIFACFNARSAFAHGWGIPTATDIAFSLAVASLLGKKFPVGLKILLMAIAIIDDLGAIVVIAVFYGNQIHWLFLLSSGLIYAALLACYRFKLKFGALQIILGIAMWYTMLLSGVEASITGVLFAFAMPIKYLAVIEHAIHKYVNFLILPVFALANTAILIPANTMDAIFTPVGMGIILGLVIGKPLGIFFASRLMVGLNIAQLPANVKWKQVFGMGTLAGIGFTMSIFTTMLAFTDTSIQDIAKIAILISVLASMVVSYFYFQALHLPAVKSTVPKAAPQPDLQLNLS
jgi:Na+:H+ antiporter, NhaA family